MRKSVIVADYDSHVKIMARTSQKFLTASPLLYDMIEQLCAVGGIVPDHLAELLARELNVNVAGMLAGDAFVLRPQSEYEYEQASWELNLLCNYRCPHCYLGDLRVDSSFDMEQRRCTIDRMVELGVLKLQITGGEPLIDRHFAETYAEAYDRGMLVLISTNGSWLGKDKFRKLFAERPPYQITVSMYGASAGSYEAMTETRPGTFKRFLRGLQSVKNMGIRLRVNIIVSTFNQHEIAEMEKLAAQYTDDFRINDQMIPAIDGDSEPLSYQNHHRRPPIDVQPFTGCSAGVKSFHIDPRGRAMICQIGRNVSVDLMREPADAMSQLARWAEQKLARPTGCAGCEIQQACSMCPLIVAQYHEAGTEAGAFCQQMC